jgi:hypothetical protein
MKKDLNGPIWRDFQHKMVGKETKIFLDNASIWLFKNKHISYRGQLMGACSILIIQYMSFGHYIFLS